GHGDVREGTGRRPTRLAGGRRSLRRGADPGGATRDTGGVRRPGRVSLLGAGRLSHRRRDPARPRPAPFRLATPLSRRRLRRPPPALASPPAPCPPPRPARPRRSVLPRPPRCSSPWRPRLRAAPEPPAARRSSRLLSSFACTTVIPEVPPTGVNAL